MKFFKNKKESVFKKDIEIFQIYDGLLKMARLFAGLEEKVNKNENRLEKLEMLVDGKMADYPIGLKFFKRYGKEKRELEIEDVLKTYNSKSELVRTEYKAFYVFMGQKVYDYVPPATVFRGLKEKKK